MVVICSLQGSKISQKQNNMMRMEMKKNIWKEMEKNIMSKKLLRKVEKAKMKEEKVKWK